MGKLDQPTHTPEAPGRKELDAMLKDAPNSEQDIQLIREGMKAQDAKNAQAHNEGIEGPDPIETVLKHYGEKIAAFNEKVDGLSRDELMAQYPEISQIHDTVMMAQRYADTQMEYVARDKWEAANGQFTAFFESETFRTYEENLASFEQIDRLFAPLLSVRAAVEASMEVAINALSKNEKWYESDTEMGTFNEALNAIRIYKLKLIQLPDEVKEAAPAWLQLGPNYGVIQQFYVEYVALKNEKRS